MAIKKEIEIDINTSKSKKQIEDLNKSINETNKEVDDVNQSSKQLTSSLDGISGGSVSAFKSLKSGLSTAVKGFKSLRVAIIGTGIGALIIAILAIKQAFTSSEEGQNKFAKLMGVIGSITGNLTDLLSDLGEYIISVFENPKKAISDFANLIKTNITNRFKGLLELIPNLGKAILLLFQGKFKEAGKVAADAVGKVTLGVESITDATQKAINKTKEFIAEMEREAQIAANIADQRAKADKIERGLIVQKAEAERKRAELLEKALQKDKYSQKERIEFLKEASKIDEEITNQQIQAAKLRRDAIIEENTLSKSNKEALQAEEEAKAQVISLETERLKRQKEVTSKIQGLIQQEAADYKAKADEIIKKKQEEANKILEEEQKLQDELKKVRDADEQERQKTLQEIENIENEYFNRKKTKEQLELEAVDEKYFLLLEKARQYGQDTAILEEEQEILRSEIKSKYENQRLEEEKNINEAKKKLALEEAKFKKQQANEVIGALGSLMSVVGQQTAAGKALGIATATINTYQGATEALKQESTLPSPFDVVAKIANVAAVLASGFKSVKSIASVRIPSIKGVSGGGGGSAPSEGGRTAAPTPPAFNIVGASSSNQLADAISGQEKQPIKAYVTTKDVSTGQSLDRNIVEGASI